MDESTGHETQSHPMHMTGNGTREERTLFAITKRHVPATAIIKKQTIVIYTESSFGASSAASCSSVNTAFLGSLGNP